MPDLPSIPGYRIEKEIGSGGMATVYLGVQEKLNRRTAIKVLEPLLLKDPNFAKRFLKEAETAANLSHPGIVHIYDVGRSENYYYMVMEYLEGGSIKDRIQRGPMDPNEAMTIIRQVAAALQYAHDQGYIHRDIKPDNIMFRKDGSTVITDFGIARAVDSTTKLTKTGMSIGTPHYMSPEQARGKTLDGRSDIYALGIVLYEMLTGHVPFDADDSVAIAVKHIQEPVPRLPAQLSRYQGLLDGLLTKEPERRVQSGSKVCELIDALLGVRMTPAAGVPTPRAIPMSHRETRREGAAPAAPVPSVLDMAEKARPARNPLVPVLAIALVVLVVILIIVSFQGQSGRVEHGAPGGAPSQVIKTSDDDAVKKREQDLQNQLAAQKAENERLQREQAAREQAAHEETARQAQDDRQRQAQEEAQRQAAQEEARRRASEEAERQAAAARAASQRRSDGRFTDNGDGTVTDTRTGLMWAARDNGSDINWDDAKRYCENYTGGGHSDWRMPTISELQGLYDESYSRKASCCPSCDFVIHISQAIGLSCYWVWSSETSGSSDARHFFFRYGSAGSYARSFSIHGRALPVRSR